MKQLLQILQRRYNAGHEFCLVLDKPPETVGPQHLKHPEKTEEHKLLHESFPVKIRQIALHGTYVGIHEGILYILRVGGPDLIDEGNEVIVDGTTSSALEINEIRLSIADHDIAGLEIPAQEGIATVRACENVPGKALEIILQGNLVEFKRGRLQETVFEIVQVEVHHPAVEAALGIA